MERGANVNAADIRKRTPLHLAVFGGHDRLVEYLISSGANPNDTAEGGVTALHVLDYVVTSLILV